MALVLSRELHTPMPQTVKMTVLEAAEWMDTIRRQPKYDPTEPS